MIDQNPVRLHLTQLDSALYSNMNELSLLMIFSKVFPVSLVDHLRPAYLADVKRIQAETKGSQ
jgi:hypothetical protein